MSFVHSKRERTHLLYILRDTFALHICVVDQSNKAIQIHAAGHARPRPLALASLL